MRSTAAMALTCLMLVTTSCGLRPGTFMGTSNEIYVTADAGSADLTRARATIREWHKSGRNLSDGVTVWLAPGRYHLDETFTLNESDSGLPGAPVVYRAMEGGKVVFTGGVSVNNWQLHEGAILRADVKDLGLNSLPIEGTDPVHGFELFYRGARMELARWPNRDHESRDSGEWAYIGSVPDEEQKREFGVLTDAERLEGWARESHAQVHIWPRYDWRDDFCGIERVDADNGIVHLSDNTSYTIAAGRRYSVRGVLSELDVPGEWYYDRDAGAIYFMPPQAIEPGDVEVSVLDQIVSIDGASNLVIRGVTFEHARDVAVEITNSSDVLIAGCIIRNVGGYGVTVEGGHDVRVAGCDITATGKGGVELGGGDRKTLTPGRNTVENCHIYEYASLRKCYSAGVKISGVGNRIANNLMHHAPHCAILLAGNDHLVEYNEIFNVVEEVQDAGAFYMGRNWTERGNVIRYNSFHDLYGYGLADGSVERGYWRYESPRFVWAIYLDDNASGTSAYGNLFYRVPMGAFHVGGGKDNVIENNTMVECYPAVHIDARWENFFAPDAEGGVNDYMRGHLTEMNYDQPPYSTAYPELVGVLDEQRIPARNRITRNIVVYKRDDVEGFHAAASRPESSTLWHLDNYDPKTTQIDSNLVWHYNQSVRVHSSDYLDNPREITPWDAWQAKGFDTRSQIADPLFIAPERDDYRLANESPADGLGIEPIPIDSIGLYEDEFRASWPVTSNPTMRSMDQTFKTIIVRNPFDDPVWHFADNLLVAGPFPLNWNGAWDAKEDENVPTRAKGFDCPYPPENTDMHQPVAVFETVDGECRWREFSSDSLAYFDLEKCFRSASNVVAYARFTIVAPEDIQTRLSLGTNDGVRAWVNGELVLDANVGRAAQPHDNIVPIQLNEGENTLLVKVANLGGQYGAFIAVEDPQKQLSFSAE
jgi:hypothetical protein